MYYTPPPLQTVGEGSVDEYGMVEVVMKGAFNARMIGFIDIHRQQKSLSKQRIADHASKANYFRQSNHLVDP